MDCLQSSKKQGNHLTSLLNILARLIQAHRRPRLILIFSPRDFSDSTANPCSCNTQGGTTCSSNPRFNDSFSQCFGQSQGQSFVHRCQGRQSSQQSPSCMSSSTSPFDSSHVLSSVHWLNCGSQWVVVHFYR